MPAPELQPRLTTPEAIVLDGANSVTGAPRKQFPEAGAGPGLSLVALVVTVALLRTRRARVVLPALLLLAAVPGAFEVLVRRADAPGRRASLATLVRVGLSDLEQVASWPSAPVKVVRDDDDVLFPLARYAWPSRPDGVDGGVEVELRGNVLTTACRGDALAGRTVCGVGP
ncbi:MAG: hypothetical protein JNJ54_04195 [Myxococcaceae bacterium]|nr:hypothetical protein [Myxococcaceae bacterium]